MDPINLTIATNFSFSPGPRFIKEGPDSGELFRTTILETKFKEATEKNVQLVIDLDGVAGYGTSFLEEAFGGLVRDFGFNLVDSSITFISEEEPYLIKDIKDYMKDAAKVMAN